MTRDEAIRLARSRTGEADPVEFIDLCVELGMLKLDKPKSAEERFVELSINQGRSEGFATDVLQILELAGLRIVEK